MASEVDICNLALSHLGDDATVSSLDPPEGSAQAEHCARFYPQARNSLLEMHDWNFATRRAQLAEVTSDWEQWRHAYVQPADCLRVLAVLDPNVPDDYSYPLVSPFYVEGGPVPTQAVYTPQPYVCETDSAGNQLIRTNQEGAMLRYTMLVSDPTKFTPLFIQALSWHLASMLAGPLLKGEAGRAAASDCIKMAMSYLSQARSSDSMQRKVTPTHAVSWMAGR